jgi:hypothetical protein
LRSRLSRVYIALFWALIVGNGLGAMLIRTRYYVAWLLLPMSLFLPVVLTFLAGLLWDDPTLREPHRTLLWLWIVLPAALLLVVLYGAITDPAGLTRDGWLVVAGVLVWNGLLPMGRLIARRYRRSPC